MKIVTFSDTHSMHERVNIPDGDILIFSGDMCGRGEMYEVEAFGKFLVSLPHKHKVVIAGNHDWPFYRDDNSRTAVELLTQGKDNIHYLEDSYIKIEDLNIYGTPWQPEFNSWAFNLPRNGNELKAIWAQIPTNTDILITHGPPFSILDYIPRSSIISLGCELLYDEVITRIKPILHVFGHIHYAYGVRITEGTTFVNSCICTESYNPIREPITIDI